MNKFRKGFYGILLLTLTMLFGMTAQAKTDDTIKTGIYAGDVELSGMTAQEATAVIEEHIESLKDVEITLLAANDHDVTITAGDLGVTWKILSWCRKHWNWGHMEMSLSVTRS